MTDIELRKIFEEYRRAGLTHKHISDEIGIALSTISKFFNKPDLTFPVSLNARLLALHKRIVGGLYVISKRTFKNDEAEETYPESAQKDLKTLKQLRLYAVLFKADCIPLRIYKNRDVLKADCAWQTYQLKRQLLKLSREERYYYHLRFNDEVELYGWIYGVLKIRKDYALLKGRPYEQLWDGEEIWKNTYGKLFEKRRGEIEKRRIEAGEGKEGTPTENLRSNILDLL